MRLASRVDGVASQVQTAVSMQTVSKSMAQVVDGLSRALEGSQMERVSMLMDSFEGQVENLNVQTAYMETAMSSSQALSTPADQVSNLMQQVADEHGLELGGMLGASAVPSGAHRESGAVEADPLTERLAKLRNS